MKFVEKSLKTRKKQQKVYKIANIIHRVKDTTK